MQTRVNQQKNNDIRGKGTDDAFDGGLPQEMPKEDLDRSVLSSEKSETRLIQTSEGNRQEFPCRNRTGDYCCTNRPGGAEPETRGCLLQDLRRDS